MNARRCLLALLAAVLVSAATAPSAAAQATRTWVASVGDDINPCSRTAPCKTLAGTITKTAEGGEINAIDSGPYGAVVITKALTIDLTPHLGGVLNSGAPYGVRVNAGADDDVVLRGLDIMGAADVSEPFPPCNYNGAVGVEVLQAHSVTVEDTKVRRQQTAIKVAAGAPVDVLVDGATITNACVGGVAVSGTGARVTLRDTAITNSGTAFTVGAGATGWLTGTTIFGNALGLSAVDGGVINDYGDNQVHGNGVNGTPTNSLAQPPAPGPAGPAGATGPAGPAGPVALKVLAASKRVTAPAGRKVMLRYVATAAARSTLTVRRAGKVVATVTGAAKAGANTIAWRSKRARAGRYALRLRAVAADGQVASARATLELRRR